MDNEDSSSLLFDIGTQVILRKSYTNAQAASDAVDKVTKDQVIKVGTQLKGNVYRTSALTCLLRPRPRELFE